MSELKQLKLSLKSSILALCLVLVSAEALARNKFEVMAGGYSLSAKSPKGSGSTSNVGLYRVGYFRSLDDQIDFTLGYTLFFSDVFSGDMGYGPDLGVVYYPWTSSGTSRLEGETYLMQFQDVYRPYFGVAFHQRQFQSVESSYAGFSASAGCEYGWAEKYSLRGEVRFSTLTGPNSATASQFDVLVGLGFNL